MLIMPYSFILFYYLQNTFIYTVSFNPHKKYCGKKRCNLVLWRGNLSSTKRWWDLNLGLPLFGASDLPHCTGLGEDLTKGLGGLLATMWQLSDLTLYSVNKVSIIFASLCPLEEQMHCQMIKTYEEFTCYLEQGLANFIYQGLDSKYFRFCEP